VPTKVPVPFSEYLAAKFKEGILAPELGADVVAILLRTEALPFQHLHNRGDLPHIGDGGFFEGHAVACGAWVAHFVTLSASKVAFGCVITSCRTQISTDLYQQTLVQLVATLARLSRL